MAITYRQDPDVNIHNSRLCLDGVRATYAQLVNLFGKPSRIGANGDSARVQWIIEFSDCEFLTIYDWKESCDVEDVTRWNIGAKNPQVTGRIYDILQGKPIEW